MENSPTHDEPYSCHDNLSVTHDICKFPWQLCTSRARHSTTPLRATDTDNANYVLKTWQFFVTYDFFSSWIFFCTHDIHWLNIKWCFLTAKRRTCRQSHISWQTVSNSLQVIEFMKGFLEFDMWVRFNLTTARLIYLGYHKRQRHSSHSH